MPGVNERKETDFSLVSEAGSRLDDNFMNIILKVASQSIAIIEIEEIINKALESDREADGLEQAINSINVILLRLKSKAN